MAESPAEPSPGDAAYDALRKRIQDYIASGKAWQHVQEGIASQGQFLDLQGFKKRETRTAHEWYGIALGQGGVHQGSTSGEAAWPGTKKLKGGHHNPIDPSQLNSKFAPRCKSSKHEWVGNPVALTFICQHCGLERKVSAEGAVQYSYPKITTQSIADQEALDPIEDWLADEDVEEASRICIWCGKVCETIEALDLHEEECEP